MTKWICAKDVWRSEKRVLPGVWKHRDSAGHVIRGEAKDPRTGRTREIFRVLPLADAATAYSALQSSLRDIRTGTPTGTPTTRPRFSEFSASLFEARVARGEIKAASTRRHWASVLKFLATAPFWGMYVDRIRRADLEEWLNGTIAPRIGSGSISPHTANDWHKFLCTICTAFVAKYELERNPMAGLAPFPTKGRRTFTVEQPNSLTPDELGPFLAELRARYPQHYAYAFLGFVCGFRPSTLRPLRRDVDVLWDDGAILVRRSHTFGNEIMDCTKTDKDQRVGLPAEIVEVLRWHVERLTFKQKATGLLFPSRWPKARPYMARSSLTRPFEDVAAVLGMTKRITAKGMRRTAVDLQRLALLDRKMRMVISGHATEAAQSMYESVPTDESRAAVAKVIDLLAWKRTA